ncbi:MAG TPA: class I SAM-dependent methyltransferase, partial [Methyloceanibacter sp.]|nr:class I SAM-dependent methyltransferase [Methyloceanibacter sp.]
MPALHPHTDAVAKAHAIYTPTMLNFYDLVVHGLSNHVAWGCPTRRLLELYRANLSANHLEAGIGTGFFLDRADGAKFDRLVLLDINQNCLDRAARRLVRFDPDLCQANLLARLPRSLERFDSIGLTYVLHCLPGRLRDKLAAVDHLR